MMSLCGPLWPSPAGDGGTGPPRPLGLYRDAASAIFPSPHGMQRGFGAVGISRGLAYVTFSDLIQH